MAGRKVRGLKWFIYFLVLLVCSALHAQQQGTVTYVYTDPQGTPLAEADANGNITKTFDYTPYGTTALGTPPSGPGYTGHVNDPETNLVYMQARYYDAATGHFLSVDPVSPTSGNTFNFNRYAYANNNPIVNIDPNGKQEEDDVDAFENLQNARTLRPMVTPPQSPSLPPAIDPSVIEQSKLAELSQPAGEIYSNLDKAVEKILEPKVENNQDKDNNTPTPRVSSRTLRSRWERANGKAWPKDPDTGRNQDVSHIKPLADGGTNDVGNIEPKTRAEHTKEHQQNGDFQRWGRRSAPKPPIDPGPTPLPQERQP